MTAALPRRVLKRRLRRSGVCCVLLGCLFAVLSGCASIPAKGPVVAGRKVDGFRPPRPEFQAAPPGPLDGPLAIVRGFLRAAVDFSQEHAVARSYLTTASRAAWDDSSVVISSSDPQSLDPAALGSSDGAIPALPSATPSPSVTPSLSARSSPAARPSPSVTASPSAASVAAVPASGSTARISLLVPVQARIEHDGYYEVADSLAEEIATFDLVVERGHWRISDPADGVLISERDFQANFREVPLYFPDTQEHWLVPDMRWFPYTAPPTTVVQALLDGPVPWLAQAVTTGAPAGTKLSANGVRTEGLITRIDLAPSVIEATPREKTILYTQLKETLQRAEQSLQFGVEDVQITANQIALVIPPQTGSVPQVMDASNWGDLRPVALDSGNHLVRLGPQGWAQSVVQGVSGLEVPGASHPAMTADGAPVYAVLVANRSRLLTQEPGRPVVEAVSGVALTAPTFDRLHWVWSTPSAPSGVVYAVRGSGLVRISAPGLSGYRVLALRVSRDGSRLLVVATHLKAAYAFVFGIVRDVDGSPTGLSDLPLRLVKDLDTVQDGSWVDDHRVVLLGTRVGVPDQRAWMVDLGGDVLQKVAANGAQSISAVDEYDLWVQGDKSIEHLVGAGLLALPEDYRWPTVPG